MRTRRFGLNPTAKNNGHSTFTRDKPRSGRKQPNQHENTRSGPLFSRITTAQKATLAEQLTLHNRTLHSRTQYNRTRRVRERNKSRAENGGMATATVAYTCGRRQGLRQRRRARREGERGGRERREGERGGRTSAAQMGTVLSCGR
jgi:hypothetical protein